MVFAWTARRPASVPCWLFELAPAPLSCCGKAAGTRDLVQEERGTSSDTPSPPSASCSPATFLHLGGLRSEEAQIFFEFP